MSKKVFVILLLAACLGCSLAKAVQDLKAQQVNGADYQTLPRRASNKREKVRDNAITTTTQRPIIRYWNSIMQRVRLPWANMTNPLVNLFNNGNANVIETPIMEYQVETEAPKRRRKQSNKRKTYSKYRYEDDDIDYVDQQQQYYDQETVVPAPPARKIYYFYDPHMRRYYGLQTVQPNDYYQAQYNTKQQPYYYDDSYQSYYHPVAQQTYSHRRPTKHHKKRVTTAAPIVEDITEDSGEVDTGEENVLMVPTEDETEMVVTTPAEVQDDDYVPADGVELVDNFNDTSDEYRKFKGAPPAIVKDEETKEKEMLRNVLGSYMSDNQANRKRQRAHAKQNKSKEKQTPRYKYFLIGNW